MPNHSYQLSQDTIDALATIDRPIEEARGLPNAFFTDQAFFAFERDTVFAKTWSVVGAGVDIPNPGDLKAVDFMGLPLLLVRTKAGEVKVFHNVCSHRGLELVNGCQSVSRLIRCPYHAWSYTLDGDLHSMPGIGGPGKNQCPGFEKEKHGLRQIRSAVWLDMIFVNLDGDAAPFATYTAPFEARWKDYDFSLLHHGGENSSWQIDLQTNWKFAVENHCDGYHLPMVHPELNAVSRLEDHYPIVGEEGFYAGQGSLAYNATRPGDAPQLPRFPSVPRDKQSVSEYLSIFPNATVGVHIDHVWIVWFQPTAPDRTVERMEIYYPGAEVAQDAAYAPTREEVHRFWFKVFGEDQWAVEGLQRGRASPAFTGGAFSPAMDGPAHAFHKWAAKAVQQR